MDGRENIGTPVYHSRKRINLPTRADSGKDSGTRRVIGHGHAARLRTSSQGWRNRAALFDRPGIDRRPAAVRQARNGARNGARARGGGDLENLYSLLPLKIYVFLSVFPLEKVFNSFSTGREITHKIIPFPICPSQATGSIGNGIILRLSFPVGACQVKSEEARKQAREIGTRRTA